MALVDPRDMLNNFCFHVYAQKSLYIGENARLFFYLLISTRACDIRVHRAGSQLKMSNVFDKSWEPAVTVSVMVTVCVTCDIITKQILTSEHRHEKKSCSACPKDQH